MFRKQSFDDKTMDTKSEEDYDFCNIETNKNCTVKVSPPSETKIYSRDQGFVSPRWLSKSLPRRNRSVIRYKINRSLNFDIGHGKNDYYTSPMTNINNSPHNNLHLSRSAKILKSLNIDYSPMRNSGYKKINKTLNFDLTPSPKRFPNANKNHCEMSKLSLTSPGINKTLNFDSSEDSPIVNSPHNTSIESIDENQNQTPSQRNSKVKKSLSYVSLSSNGSNTSFDFNLLSPSLRTDLREKIDDIVQTSMSPLQSMKNSPGHDIINSNTMIVSTPRNLVNDLSDDDDDRPETPENAIRLIPESMSSIKKSHRKERVSGRFSHRIQIHTLKPITIETVSDDTEQRPLTPSTSNNEEQTPNYKLRSIKKSHKKDKSRWKFCGYHSEDELSETGSLFDYSTIENEEITNNKSECNSIEENEISITENSIDSQHIIVNNENKEIIQTPLKRLPEDEENSNTVTTPTTSGPTTPENRIDYLRRIMTDSIKKSHKKLKESNKKSILKKRILGKLSSDIESNEFSLPSNNKKNEDQLNNDNNCVTSPSKSTSSVITNNENRSCTPENMNSSRLLLGQFSSVKKSHRKDKLRKMGFAQRHIVMAQEDECNSSSSTSPDNNIRNKASVLSYNIPSINITEASLSNCTFDSSSSSICSDDSSEYCSLGTSPLEENDDINIKSKVSSPNKRKSPRSDENGNAEISSSFSNESRIVYESAEEEFKIFTPIKKRKPLTTLSTPIIFNNNNSPEKYPENSLSSGRCDTPKIGINIITPDRKNDSVIPENDNDKCIKQVTTNNTTNDNGRLTPENNGRLERISALSSIKKSHKKDKWANARRRSIRALKETSENIITCEREKNFNSSINNWRSSRIHELSSDSGEKTDSFDDDISSPMPSTSYSNNKIIESRSPTKTPPNGLEAKTYLRLIQTTSIKRSHKKMRERKKLESIIFDPNLSDDGSIFDETEKTFNDSANEHLRSNEFDDNHEDFMPLDNNVNNKKMHYSKDSNSFSGNRSNDGSIFGSDGEMDSLHKL